MAPLSPAILALGFVSMPDEFARLDLGEVRVFSFALYKRRVLVAEE